MTDRETLITMFERAGVATGPESLSYPDDPDGPNRLRVGSEGASNDGYGGFYAEFSFDDDGALKTVGIWE